MSGCSALHGIQLRVAPWEEPRHTTKPFPPETLPFFFFFLTFPWDPALHARQGFRSFSLYEALVQRAQARVKVAKVVLFLFKNHGSASAVWFVVDALARGLDWTKRRGRRLESFGDRDCVFPRKPLETRFVVFWFSFRDTYEIMGATDKKNPTIVLIGSSCWY